jgi:hypothetical protein
MSNKCYRGVRKVFSERGCYKGVTHTSNTCYRGIGAGTMLTATIQSKASIALFLEYTASKLYLEYCTLKLKDASVSWLGLSWLSGLHNVKEVMSGCYTCVKAALQRCYLSVAVARQQCDIGMTAVWQWCDSYVTVMSH